MLQAKTANLLHSRKPTGLCVCVHATEKVNEGGMPARALESPVSQICLQPFISVKNDNPSQISLCRWHKCAITLQLFIFSL